MRPLQGIVQVRLPLPGLRGVWLELVDAPDLKSGVLGRTGSTPVAPTVDHKHKPEGNK